MKRTLLALALLLAPTAAGAVDVKLTNEDAILLFQGLGALEGYDHDAGDKVIRKVYSLDGSVRLVIARNMAALKPIVDAFSKARTDLHRQVFGGLKPEPGSQKAKDFTSQVETMMAEEQTVDLARFSSKDLKIDENPISPAVLVALRPILTDFDEIGVPADTPPAEDKKE